MNLKVSTNEKGKQNKPLSMNFTSTESSLSDSLANEHEGMDLKLGRFKIGYKLSLLDCIAKFILQGCPASGFRKDLFAQVGDIETGSYQSQ